MRHPTVYLVDAFPDEREMYGDYLSLRGFEVRTFEYPEAAIAAVNAAPPSAVITRIRQERGSMDGIALTAVLRANSATRDAAIIVITSSSLASDHRAAMRAGCDACLLLPATPDDLVKTLKTALRVRTLRT